ncbi:MAG: hypothetical protein HRT66_09445 [Flavobacteriaceae bacterium]|nr:hypothetical protein [Flavobacteriaceae bacterium]
MKKIFCLLFSSILLLGCNDDDDETKKLIININDIVIGINSVQGELTIVENRGYSIEFYGLAYSTSNDPTTDNMVFEADFNDGKLTISLDNLDSDTVYYVKGFVITSKNETLYSEEISINTLSLETAKPIFEINEISDIKDLSATANANIIDDKGYDIIRRGFVYGYSVSFTDIDVELEVINNSELFSSIIPNLEANAEYYIKAFVENEYSTFYSDPLYFTTKYTPNTFVGDIILTNQKEIDIFASKNHTSIQGNLVVGYNMGMRAKPSVGTNKYFKSYNRNELPETDINDISALKSVSQLSGSLHILGNINLESLEGLDNITEVKELYILENNNLTSLIGLSGLTKVEGILAVAYCPSLTSLSGLHNITNEAPEDVFTDANNGTMNDIVLIIENENLTNLEGLGGYKYIKQFGLSSNSKLTNLQALDSLEALGFWEINDNDALTSLNSLNSEVTDILYISITNNELLVNLEGFENIETISHLEINSNPKLESLIGLTNLINLDKLNLFGNNGLVSLEGMGNVEYLINGLKIENNTSLQNLNGLESIKKLTSLTLKGNENLFSLSGLDNMEYIQSDIIITDNSKLQDFCALGYLFYQEASSENELGFLGSFTVSGNEYNPSQLALELGDCNIPISNN